MKSAQGAELWVSQRLSTQQLAIVITTGDMVMKQQKTACISLVFLLRVAVSSSAFFHARAMVLVEAYKCCG